MQDPTIFPPQIKEISGKEITLRIELTDDNILLNSTLYYAIDAYDSSVSTSSKSGTTLTGTEVSMSGDVSFKNITADFVTFSVSSYNPFSLSSVSNNS